MFMAHVSSWNLPRVCTVIALQCSSMPIKMHSYVIWSTSETLASIWLLLTPRSFCLVATEIHVHFALQKFAYLWRPTGNGSYKRVDDDHLEFRAQEVSGAYRPMSAQDPDIGFL